MAFPNLPGTTVTLNDLGLQVSPPPSGPKVTLLGITSNLLIPINEPLTITNLGQATSQLWFSGLSGNVYPGELALAAEEAALAGAGAIELMVIGHVSGQALRDYIAVTGGAGGAVRYADLSTAYDILLDRDVDIVVPVGAYADDVPSTGGYGKQLANFCYQSTTEIDSSAVGVISMMPVVHWADVYQADISTGNSAVSGEVLSIVEDDGDYFFGSPSTALVSEWAKYASQTSTPIVEPGNAVFPTIWSSYLNGSEDESANYYPTNNANGAVSVNSSYWNHWQAQTTAGTLATDRLGNKVDVGSRITVVGSPLRTSTSLTRNLALGVGASASNTFHTTDGAAAYAGFMSRLRPHSAPTNKQIASLSPQRPLSSSQANGIVGRRIVTFHKRSTGFVVSSAITGAHNVSKFVRSDFTRLTTVRIVDAAIDIVRAVGDRFIGEPNSAAHRNAMAAEIDKLLSKMKTATALNDYQFFVSATPDQQVLGEATIELTLVPAFELINISLNVSLRKEI